MSKKGNGAGTVAAVCRTLAEPYAAQIGVSLWDVRYVKEGADWILRYTIDKPGGVDINDCVDLTHLLNPVLDEADPIPQSYCLEVTSPGVERELTRPEHFEAYCQRPVTVRLYQPDETGNREYVGILVALNDETLSLDIGDAEETIREFSRKTVASVHAVDVWDETEATDETIMEE